MSINRKFKTEAREYAAEHGVNYTTAFRRFEVLAGLEAKAGTEKHRAGVAALGQLIAEHGVDAVPQRYSRFAPAQSLGQWVAAQRVAHKSSELTPESMALLESIPDWDWGSPTDRLDAGFVALDSFVGREGHSRVPETTSKGRAN